MIPMLNYHKIGDGKADWGIEFPGCPIVGSALKKGQCCIQFDGIPEPR